MKLTGYRPRPVGRRLAIALVAASLAAAALGCEREAEGRRSRRKAARDRRAAAQEADPPADEAPAANGDEKQPLSRAIAMARKAVEKLDGIAGYTCTFVKRERVDGKLLDEQRMTMKIRHDPFSVYTRFLAPESYAGQEAIYVEGRNDGNLIAHPVGLKGKLVGTVTLDPHGFLAMSESRYPITDSGMKNLLGKLIALGEQRELMQDCRVEFRDNGEVDRRPCNLIDITRPKTNGKFKLAECRIWIDREWELPVKFEVLEWPPRGDPWLVEQYTYLDVELDAKLDDGDFDPKNPEYQFP